MAKEKVFIVLSHKHSLKKDKSGKGVAGDWEVSETVEFVNQLKNKHMTDSTAIADYLNRKVLSGTRYGITEYDAFLEYLHKKYPEQLAELDSKYGKMVIKEPVQESDLITDQFGNIRPRTVFDLA